MPNLHIVTSVLIFGSTDLSLGPTLDTLPLFQYSTKQNLTLSKNIFLSIKKFRILKDDEIIL